jgi:propionate CoA-transferase
MGLESSFLGRNVDDRVSYDAGRNTLFANFEGLNIRTIEDVEQVRREFETRCREIGHKVNLIVNYDNFVLDPAVSDAYFSVVSYLEDRYYATTARYTTSAFMRLKLGAALAERALAPHVFETLNEANAHTDGPAQVMVPE